MPALGPLKALNRLGLGLWSVILVAAIHMPPFPSICVLSLL